MRNIGGSGPLPQEQPRQSRTAWVVWGIVILLAILHQDFWLWDDTTLVFGFMPIGLAYHAMFSIAAGTVWLVAVKWAWPSHIEQWALEEPEDRKEERHE